MSKERARRREERAIETARAAAARAAELERLARRSQWRRRLLGWIPQSRPVPSGTLAARRRRSIRLVLTAVFIVNALVFLASDGWALRAVVLLLSLLITPVVTLLISQK